MAAELADPANHDVDAAGVDRRQIREFLRLSLVERLAWLDDYTASLRELQELNPQLRQP